jgi:hypothetical protein
MHTILVRVVQVGEHGPQLDERAALELMFVASHLLRLLHLSL